MFGQEREDAGPTASLEAVPLTQEPRRPREWNLRFLKLNAQEILHQQALIESHHTKLSEACNLTFPYLHFPSREEYEDTWNEAINACVTKIEQNAEQVLKLCKEL